jgi:DNA modification methylase
LSNVVSPSIELREGRWELRLGDCLDPATGLASLADKSVDHVLTDPPYSAHVHESCRSGLTASNNVDKRKNKISERKALGFEHLDADLIPILAQHLARITRRWIHVFSDVESCHLWRLGLEAAGSEYIRTLAWDKHGGAPQFTGDRPAVGFETITLAHAPGKKRWNGGGKRGVYSHSIVLNQRGEPRLHPTQKPFDLIESLLFDFSDRDDLILDAFAGSGTTGAAALRNGRCFLGWEQDQTHHTVAHDRLTRTREQHSFFDAPVATNFKQTKFGGL